jgi:hypothetical protein
VAGANQETSQNHCRLKWRGVVGVMEEGVGSRMARVLARVQRQLRERDERIALLEQQLARRDEESSEQVAALLREVLGSGEEEMEEAQGDDSDVTPVPAAAAPLVLRPQLSSRLSASGTDFSAFSKRAGARQRLSGVVTGLPAASSESPLGEEIALAPSPLQSPVVPRPAANNSSGWATRRCISTISTRWPSSRGGR